jgi:diadenosine tetraphosphate (Ap4A) HIT family hydrolase
MACCAFCDRAASGDVLLQNELAVAFYDGYPVSPGHCLVIPRRHEPDFFALTGDEQSAIWSMAREAQSRLGLERSPDGFNIGVNIGDAAGQTIGHAHLHVIPRYRGDVADPRGGVRWVIPARAAYWETP